MVFQNKANISLVALSTKLSLFKLLQFNLRVNQRKEPCIRITQKKSIENSVQDSLSYILITHSSCFTTLAYPK